LLITASPASWAKSGAPPTPNLNRGVTIRILPDAFAQDAGRVARFTREVQVLASLNLPNISVMSPQYE